MAFKTFLKSVSGRLSFEKNNEYKGFIDGIIDECLQGWIRNSNNSTSVLIDIFIDHELTYSDVLCNFDRSDLKEAGVIPSTFGFRVPFDASRYGDNILVAVHLSGQNEVLLTRTIELNSSFIQEKKTASPSVAPISRKVIPIYRARIESLKENKIIGWAVDTLNPGAKIKAELFINGVWFCDVINDKPRDDLRRQKLSYGDGGIEQVLPAQLLVSGNTTVGLRFPDGHYIEQSFSLVCTELVTPQVVKQIKTPVTIVVPIYNAVEDTKSCIERVLAFTPPEVRLLLINDASTDEAVAPMLKKYADRPQVKVMTNETNIGFTRTVNRGIDATGTDDVIFLNSDARVTPGWLQGLRSAVASDPLIGTVTPLSDRAGAFSAPRIGNDNKLPFGISEEEYAVAVRRHSLRLYPTVPTGNGFCMYVRRACIDQVGKLDEDAFPRGYGEENDFCMRARRLGWRSIIDDATYVFHERSRSFGDQKTELMAAGRKAVEARHPDYSYAIRVFSASPQIALARYRVGQAQAALTHGETFLPRALFVTATMTGGTPQTNRDLMRALSDSWEGWLLRCDSNVMTLSRLADDEFEVVETHSLQEPVSPTNHRSFEYDRVLGAWLAKYEFTLVHIRQLIWHSLSLPRLAKESGAVVINSFHDFYTISPSVKLLDEDNIFRGVTCPEGKAYASTDLWPENSMPRLGPDWSTRWQKMFADALAVCDAFVTTSPSARDMIMKVMPPETAERFAVIPHGRDFPEMRRNFNLPVPEQALRILVPGNISVAKGRAVIEGLLDRDEIAQRLEFHILGDHDFPTKRRGLHFHGLYKREDFINRVEQISPHVGAVFSIWDETYCHTLTEMRAASLPVIGLDYPTVAGRIRAANGGWVYSETDIDVLYDNLVRDMEDSIGFMERLRGVIDWQRGEGRANTSRNMASKYQALYQAVIHSQPSLGTTLDTTLDTTGPHFLVLRTFEDWRVAVVCPANTKLTQAPASTHVRVWARTYNNLGRAINFVRMTPEELLAATRTGIIDKAIIQRNALPATIWRSLKPLVAAGALRYAFDLDDDLSDVPSDKDPDGTYAAYAATLDDVITHAAVITTSTKALATNTTLADYHLGVLR